MSKLTEKQNLKTIALFTFLVLIALSTSQLIVSILWNSFRMIFDRLTRNHK